MNKQIIQQNLDGCDDKWRGYTDKGEEKTAPFADWLAEEIEAQNILDRGEAATLKEAYTVFYHRMAEYLEKEGDNEAASLLLEYINNEGTDWNLDEKRLDYLVHLGYEFVHLEYAFEQQLVEQSEDYRNLKTRYSKQQGNFTITEKGLRGIPTNDEKIVDFLIDKIIETGFGKGEDFTVNCLFNFNVKYSSYDYNKEIISMESCDLNLHNDNGCNKELDEIDPDRKVFSGMYNDVYLLFLNDGDIQIQITIDSGDELAFDLTNAQYHKLTESFDYKLYAYDKDKGSSVFCGIHNDLDGAIDLAKAAYKAETERTDRNREDREVYDIDWVEICDKDDTRIGFAYYDNETKEIVCEVNDKRHTVDKDKPKEGEIIMSREIIQQGLDGDDDKWCGYTDGGEKLTSCFADWLAQDIELHNLVESGEANNLDEAYDLFFRRMAKWEADEGYDEFAQLLLQHVDDKNVDCGDIDEDRLDFLRYLGYKFIPQKELSESKDKPKEVER